MQAALFGSFKLSFTLFLLSFILVIQDICTLILVSEILIFYLYVRKHYLAGIHI